MTIRNVGLKLLDKFRAKLDYKYDLRRYDVIMRVFTYPGTQIGEGTPTFVDTLIGIKNQFRPKVENISTDDVVNSGNVYSLLDLKVGPLTPTFSTGGNDPSDFNPPYDTTLNTQVLYRVTGPGMEQGAWFDKIGQEVYKNFKYYIILRKSQSSPV
jgi:hypothetical protein